MHIGLILRLSEDIDKAGRVGRQGRQAGRQAGQAGRQTILFNEIKSQSNFFEVF